MKSLRGQAGALTEETGVCLPSSGRSSQPAPTNGSQAEGGPDLARSFHFSKVAGNVDFSQNVKSPNF